MAPPLLGAVIGYVTNAIAIRMLFRPLAEKRLFGVRLPLTPGIIPKQRYELAESIARMVASELITPDAERRQAHSLGELAQLALGLGEQELTEAASVRVLDYLSRPESSQAIAAEVVAFSWRFLEEHRGDCLRSLLRVDPEAQRRAGAWLSERLSAILEERVPALIEGFDLRQLVVDKVNGLDVTQVEKLLLGVIARQLKWINVFGGILGALIGLVQLLLRLPR